MCQFARSSEINIAATLDAISLLLTEQARITALLERLIAQPALTLHGIERENGYCAQQERVKRRDEATRELLAATHQEDHAGQAAAFRQAFNDGGSRE